MYTVCSYHPNETHDTSDDNNNRMNNDDEVSKSFLAVPNPEDRY